jgi:hypothetical protein
LSFIPSYGYLVYITGRTVVVKSRTGRGLGPIWLTIAVFVLGMVLTFVVAAQMMTVMTDVLGTYGYR